MPRKKPSELKLAKGRMDIYEKPDTQAKIAKLRAEISKIEEKKQEYKKYKDERGIIRADEKIALIENTIRRMSIGK